MMHHQSGNTFCSVSIYFILFLSSTSPNEQFGIHSEGSMNGFKLATLLSTPSLQRSPPEQPRCWRRRVCDSVSGIFQPKASIVQYGVKRVWFAIRPTKRCCIYLCSCARRHHKLSSRLGNPTLYELFAASIQKELNRAIPIDSRTGQNAVLPLARGGHAGGHAFLGCTLPSCHRQIRTRGRTAHDKLPESSWTFV